MRHVRTPTFALVPLRMILRFIAHAADGFGGEHGRED
jgi:hypothetical protein